MKKRIMKSKQHKYEIYQAADLRLNRRNLTSLIDELTPEWMEVLNEAEDISRGAAAMYSNQKVALAVFNWGDLSSSIVMLVRSKDRDYLMNKMTERFGPGCVAC